MIVAAAGVIASGVAEPAASAQRRGKKKPPAERTVRVETLPDGADVYLGDKESGSRGTTPLDLQLPPGEHILILELAGHLPRFETLLVDADDDTTLTFTYELDPATAFIVIEADEGVAVPEGTTVRIDGEDRGAPPVRVELEAGAHQVEIVAPGKPPFEQWVDLQGGEEKLMAIDGATLGGAEVAAVATPATPKPSGRRAGTTWGTVRVGVQLGFRRFRYESPRTANLAPYDARGNGHGVVDVELHPWRPYVDSALLDRITILGGGGYSPVITASDDAGMMVDAYWRSHHAGLRVRALDAAVAIDIDAEWMHTLYTFRDENNVPATQVPDVDYHMLRFGGRLVFRAGSMFEGWAGADNRIVITGGPLEDRFRSSNVDGVSARAGLAARFAGSHLEARVEGEYTRIGWTFESEPGDTYDADGATDTLSGVTFTVGGSY